MAEVLKGRIMLSKEICRTFLGCSHCVVKKCTNSRNWASGITQILGLASGVTQILALRNAEIYQHVGISNAEFWRRGHYLTPTPDAGYFASQWNIGLNLTLQYITLNCVGYCVFQFM